MSLSPLSLDLVLTTGLPALAFAAVMVGSPGPANMAFLASGAAVGYRRTVPFIIGAISGFMVLIVALAAGLGEALERLPALALAMKIASSVYILYLAYKIATAPVTDVGTAKPAVGFWPGTVVHPLNPKAWAMQLTALSQFIDPASPYWPQALFVMLAFLVVAFPLNSAWALAGRGVRSLIHRPDRLRALNITLAVLTVLVVGVALVL